MQNFWSHAATSLTACFGWCVVVTAQAPYRAPAQANQASLNRILTAENQRVAKDPYLATAIHHPTPSIRQAAIYAVARIGDASLLGDLSGELNHKRGPHKKDVAFALGLIPDETALTIAVQHLAMQQDPEILAELYLSIGRAGGEKNVPVFAEALRNQANPNVLQSVCLGLGALWAKDSENWAVPPGVVLLLIQRAKQTDALALACSFALSRFKGIISHLPPNETVKLAEQVKSREAAGFLMRVIAKIHTPAASTFLIQKAAPFAPLANRIEAIKALSQHPFSKPIQAALRSALEAPQSQLLVQTLEGIQAYQVEAKELSPFVLALYKKSHSTWVRGKALRAGMAVDPELWKPLVLKEISDSKSDLRSMAAGALSYVPSTVDAPLIATLLKDLNQKLALDILESLSGWPEDAFTPEIKSSIKGILEKKDPALIAAVAVLVERFKWADLGSPLAAAYANLTKPDMVETKVAVLTALTALASSSYTSVFETALKDPEKLVVIAAVDGLKETAKRDESVAIPLNSKAGIFPFTGAQIQQAVGSKVILKTNRGEIHFRMLKEAPLSSLNFVRLVRDGFYTGLAFHRVVPNFVAQGGDPRGDGFGGPGYLVRDEISPRQNKRGTVGIATSGKDTGGSQFFINLAPNFHLDGRFTVFAEVTQGLEIADALEVGDKILSARWIP